MLVQVGLWRELLKNSAASITAGAGEMDSAPRWMTSSSQRACRIPDVLSWGTDAQPGLDPRGCGHWPHLFTAGRLQAITSPLELCTVVSALAVFAEPASVAVKYSKGQSTGDPHYGAWSGREHCSYRTAGVDSLETASACPPGLGKEFPATTGYWASLEP